MALNAHNDPIYGLATPQGRSAISVIRISGKSLPKDLVSYVDFDEKSAGLCVKTLQLDGFSDQCLFLFFPFFFTMILSYMSNFVRNNTCNLINFSS